MPEIQLRRPTGYRTDRLRDYQIYIDGQKIGKISPDETQAFELPTGPHELQLKIDGATSEKLRVDLSENSQEAFICAPRVKRDDFSVLGGYRLFYWMTFGYRRYIDLCRAQDFNPEEESSWISNLKESTLFVIALAIGVGVFVVTGEIIVILAVLLTACIFVLLKVVFRPVDRAFSQIGDKSQKRQNTD